MICATEQKSISGQQHFNGKIPKKGNNNNKTAATNYELKQIYFHSPSLLGSCMPVFLIWDCGVCLQTVCATTSCLKHF